MTQENAPEIKRTSVPISGHKCNRKCFGLWPGNVTCFVDWLLEPGNIATRPPSQGGHQRQRMKSRYLTYDEGPSKLMRGTDRVERIYAVWEVLRMSSRYVTKHGSPGDPSFCTMERLIESRLRAGVGHGRRGRPLKQGTRKFHLSEKTGTNYGLWRTYRDRHQWKGQCPDPVVSRRLLEYLHFCAWAKALKLEARNDPKVLRVARY